MPNSTETKSTTAKTDIQPKKVVMDQDRYKSPKEGRRNYIRLDFNENTAPLLSGDDYSAYPEYDPLLENLAEIFAVDKENLLPTNGTDEALSLIASTFIEPSQDQAMVSQPTFALIQRSMVLAGGKTFEVPVRSNLSYDTEELEKVLTDNEIKLATFASPDNPTGSVLDLKLIESWLVKFPRTLFVLDEAYADYIYGKNAYNHTSSIALTRKYNNLLVTRTFSKAWGLAGLRLGIIIGDSEKLEYLARMRMPYSVNSYIANKGSELVALKPRVIEAAIDTMERKASLLKALSDIGYRVVANDGTNASDNPNKLDDIVQGSANFFMVNCKDQSGNFCQFMKGEGILVRNRASEDVESPMYGMVRISIGTQEENSQLLKAIRKWRQARRPDKVC